MAKAINGLGDSNIKKYGDSGDIIYSLEHAYGKDGNQDLPLKDAVTDEHLPYGQDGIKKDLFEILLKGAAFDLCEKGIIKDTERDIFLFCLGIDEYWPRMSAKELGVKFGIDNLKVRTIRFQVAKKVRKEILTDDDQLDLF